MFFTSWAEKRGILNVLAPRRNRKTTTRESNEERHSTGVDLPVAVPASASCEEGCEHPSTGVNGEPVLEVPKKQGKCRKKAKPKLVATASASSSEGNLRRDEETFQPVQEEFLQQQEEHFVCQEKVPKEQAFDREWQLREQKERLLECQRKREREACLSSTFAKNQRVRYFHKASGSWFEDAHIVGVHHDDGDDQPYYTIEYQPKDPNSQRAEKQTTRDRLQSVEWDETKSWVILSKKK